MNKCICVDCPNKCYEYENNSTSDKAYYEWAYKEDKCKAICGAIEDLSERVNNIEKQMKENKEEKIKKLEAELEYAKFRSALPTIMNMMSDN